MNEIIPYGRQEITEEDIQTVVATLKGDYLTQGPLVAEFEKRFASFVGATHAVAVNNATAALHLSTLALSTQPGQRVLCTPNSFVASSNCVLYCGADVEFVDIDPVTFCIDLDALERKLKTSPRGHFSGIIAVDFAGYPLDFARIREISNRHGLWVIEDACHAPGAEFQTSSGKWHKSGSGEFADLATFSFHPVKHIATGEGGMITTRSAELAQRLRLLRTHGITKDPAEMNRNDGSWFMEMQSLGMNYRMPDILCALGISQLGRMESNLERRRALAQNYDRAFEHLPIVTPKAPENIRHAYHLYVIRTKKRKELHEYLKAEGILSQVHYIPIYQQPFYLNKYGQQHFPQMESYYQEALSLPLFHGMTPKQQDRVIHAVSSFFK